MRKALFAAALAAVLVSSGQADAFEMGGNSFESQKVWFRAGDTPVGTVDYQLGSPIRWSTEAPAGPVAATLGNNYSVFMDLVEPGMREAFTFSTEGTFVGNLETIAVDLYYAGPFAGVCDMSLSFQVIIDGAEILMQEHLAPSANLKEEAGPNRTRRVRFMFSNLHDTMNLFGVQTGPGVEHEIWLNFANFYACNEAVWLYDSATFPSGMIFNMDPASTEARKYTTVDVQNPPPPLS